MSLQKILIIISLVQCVNTFAQDLIIKKNGEKIYGKINNQDSTRMYFTTFRNDEVISSNILLSKIDTVFYNKISKADRIEIDNDFSRTYMYKGIEYSHKRLEEILIFDPESYIMYRNARNTKFFARAVLVMGSFLVLFPFSQLAFQKQPFWHSSLIGGGVALLSIPLFVIANERIYTSIQKYNKNITLGCNYNFDIGLYLSFSQFGISVKF
ncbi:MAG: hypothetical protein SFY32_13930 [Bacteroidota bacterium]|nr:hypothetical protein [Bacteroidota bacterium]